MFTLFISIKIMYTFLYLKILYESFLYELANYI
jgi:hypothetical protein